MDTSTKSATGYSGTLSQTRGPAARRVIGRDAEIGMNGGANGIRKAWDVGVRHVTTHVIIFTTTLSPLPASESEKKIFAWLCVPAAFRWYLFLHPREGFRAFSEGLQRPR